MQAKQKAHVDRSGHAGKLAESFGCRGLPLWVAKAGTRARRATAAAFKSARPSGFDAGFSLTRVATRFALGS